WSELAEERQQFVGWLVTPGLGGGRGCAGDGLFFECHVGVKVDAAGSRAFVAEPQGDDGDVDACVQPGREQCSNLANAPSRGKEPKVIRKVGDCGFLRSRRRSVTSRLLP